MHTPAQEPPPEVWLQLADLAEKGRRRRDGLPPLDREWCASDFDDRVGNILLSWCPEWTPRVAILRDLAKAVRNASSAIEALHIAEHGALADMLGVGAAELIRQIEQHTAFLRRLESSAIQIAPLSGMKGAGQPPKNVIRRIGSEESEGARRRGESLRAGEWVEVVTPGECVLLCLLEVAKAHHGHFTYHSKAKGEPGGTLIEAWKTLSPYMPDGIELPAADRIKRLRSEVRELDWR